ncbi:MAG: 23S rRNA (cytosine(1962)-C(5))-methyltransferase RlmI, partial [Anaerolineae bacterium]|nr:23S rRNA (cytosine(1962)-C(5))-methyltransferase RlmI [Anaerolineae bacterium]
MSSDRVSGSVILKRGRSKPVQQHHPWVFSGAIERVEGDPADGDLVDVRDTGRNFLARGYINQRSQIVVRILSWDPDERIDAQFWRERIKRANDARGALAANVGTTAYRVVHAESDYLPGLIVDCYGDWLVIQFLTLGVVARQEPIVEALVDLLSPRGIYERSD